MPRIHDRSLEEPPEHPDDCGCRECAALSSELNRYLGIGPAAHLPDCECCDCTADRAVDRLHAAIDAGGHSPPHAAGTCDACDYVRSQSPPLPDDMLPSGPSVAVVPLETDEPNPCGCGRCDACVLANWGPDPLGDWHGRNE